MLRLRMRVFDWPRLALVITDTPRPDCPECAGEGGCFYDYGDYATGEYEGTEWAPCPCWNEDRCMVLLPLPRRPRWLRRRDAGRDPWASDGYSDEPPF